MQSGFNFEGCFFLSQGLSCVVAPPMCTLQTLGGLPLCTSISYVWMSGNAKSQKFCNQVCVLCTVASDRARL